MLLVDVNISPLLHLDMILRPLEFSGKKHRNIKASLVVLKMSTSLEKLQKNLVEP
jgi:hypothetical protein